MPGGGRLRIACAGRRSPAASARRCAARPSRGGRGWRDDHMGDRRAPTEPQPAAPDGSATMIASVNGRVAAVSPNGAVVEVGGIGLAVQCTPGTIARLQVGENARLATSLIVREDSLTLYGFADDDERQLFELLQTANGVGPRLAQAVLAIHPPREIRRAVSMGDLKALMQVPGIGKKGEIGRASCRERVRGGVG